MPRLKLLTGAGLDTALLNLRRAYRWFGPRRAGGDEEQTATCDYYRNPWAANRSTDRRAKRRAIHSTRFTEDRDIVYWTLVLSGKAFGLTRDQRDIPMDQTNDNLRIEQSSGSGRPSNSSIARRRTSSTRLPSVALGSSKNSTKLSKARGSRRGRIFDILAPRGLLYRSAQRVVVRRFTRRHDIPQNVITTAWLPIASARPPAVGLQNCPAGIKTVVQALTRQISSKHPI